MKSRMAIAVTALTFGSALAAIPSFAQTRDRSNGPEVQQESTGTVPQQESKACVHFQQGCSDKPYPMAQGASPNSGRTSARERLSSERTSDTRTRAAERERVSGSARVSERTRTSGAYMRSAAPEPSGARERVAVGVGGETYSFGGRRDYYNAAPGAEVAGAPSSAIAMCETRFHSFDPVTGTYMGFDGIRHPCP